VLVVVELAQSVKTHKVLVEAVMAELESFLQ
jgi:hypothetical protein